MQPIATRVVSSDSHVNPPTDMWAEYLPADLRDAAPVLERTDDGDFEVFEGRRKPLTGLTAAAGRRPEEYTMTVRRLDDVRAGGWSPAPRIEDQDLDGVDAEVLFGGVAGAPLMSGDPTLARASYSAYNHWLADFCSYAPDRLIGVAYVPAADPDDAIAEVRDAAVKGLRGALLPQVPDDGSWADDRWEPLWHELTSLAWPAHFHVGGRGALQSAAPTNISDPAAFLNSMVARKLEMSLALGTIVFSGILERHPDLNFVSVEGQIGWVPFWKEYADHAYAKHRWHLDHHLAEKPSTYIERQVFYTFMEDHHGAEARHACGVDRIMWASDYPHSETTWPDSQKILAEQFAGAPLDEVRRIVHDNCTGLYRIG